MESHWINDPRDDETNGRVPESLLKLRLLTTERSPRQLSASSECNGGAKFLDYTETETATAGPRLPFLRIDKEYEHGWRRIEWSGGKVGLHDGAGMD